MNHLVPEDWFVIRCANGREGEAEHPHMKGSVVREPSRYGFAHVTLPTRGAAIVLTASAVAFYKDAMDM
jgi:hypothetical protein